MFFLLSGCGTIKNNMQPVVTFIVTGENSTFYEKEIILLSSVIAKENELYYLKRESKYYGIIIDGVSKQNGLMFDLGLSGGKGAKFDIFITKTKTTISIGGLPNEPKVHTLIKDWQKSLDESGIKYFKLIRQPYLDNNATPDDDPHWEGIKGYPSRKKTKS